MKLIWGLLILTWWWEIQIEVCGCLLKLWGEMMRKFTTDSQEHWDSIEVIWICVVVATPSCPCKFLPPFFLGNIMGTAHMVVWLDSIFYPSFNLPFYWKKHINMTPLCSPFLHLADNSCWWPNLHCTPRP